MRWSRCAPSTREEKLARTRDDQRLAPEEVARRLALNDTGTSIFASSSLRRDLADERIRAEGRILG